MVSDPLALQYILNSGHFALSPVLQNMVGLVFGDGSLMGIRGKAHADVRLPGSEDATGQMHRRIRNEFNIGFSAAAVRTYQPIFEKVAQVVRISAHISIICLIQPSVCSDQSGVRSNRRAIS
jgi:cytochrome P450